MSDTNESGTKGAKQEKKLEKWKSISNQKIVTNLVCKKNNTCNSHENASLTTDLLLPTPKHEQDSPLAMWKSVYPTNLHTSSEGLFT